MLLEHGKRPSDIPLVHADKFYPPLSVSLGRGQAVILVCTTVHSPAMRSNAKIMLDCIFFINPLTGHESELSDIDEQVRRFIEVVRSGMNKYILLHKPVHSKFPQWFSTELRSSVPSNIKTTLPERQSDLGLTSEMRSLDVTAHFAKVFTSKITSSIESLEVAASQKPADFWRYVCCHSMASKGNSLNNANGELVTNVAVSFAQYFRSIFGPPDTSHQHQSFN